MALFFFVFFSSFFLSTIEYRIFTKRSFQYALKQSDNTADFSVQPIPIKLNIKEQLAVDMKESMKQKQKQRLSAIRAIQTAIKQKEVDDRITVDDDIAILIMSKLIKQRKESIKSYIDGNRQDLVDAEQAECDVISTYMPVQLSKDEIEAIIDDVIRNVQASTIKDTGKVMNQIKPILAGKADIAEVGNYIKKKLGGK